MATLRRFPGGVFRAFLPQPRNVVGGRSAAVAHDSRRLGALRRAPHGAVPGAHPAAHAGRIRASHCRRASSSRRRAANPNVSTESSSPVTATRRCACLPIRRRWSVRCWALSATSATTCCCIPIRVCCRVAGSPGPRGTTTCPVRIARHGARRRHVQHEHPAAPQTRTPLLVTLNMAQRVDPARVIRHSRYEHPVFTPAAVAAQARQAEINGAQSRLLLRRLLAFRLPRGWRRQRARCARSFPPRSNMHSALYTGSA